MERKVEKELKEAQDDLQEAISSEKARAASVSELKQQSIDMEKSMGAFQTESEAAKNRIWWKSAKWIAIASILIILIFGTLFFFIASKLKGTFSSDSPPDTDQ
ncbi:hypothetical protein NEHOM01_0491 [Nematocida homosporus]|uniref:uncharacterized protein n=1 Tax=Nematocida homosporus TaxID=1912981 RepID=UPI00221EECB1|nr:uncharacterized protein NEHOM01_0491 [Nematocida homosporus]KAI5184940.1 hypothetical protein NEHOM01_0491 [Nematocida homosporus]